MADLTISQLPSASSVSTNDIVIVDQAGPNTRKATVGQLINVIYAPPPTGNATTDTANLQAAIVNGGDIVINRPGTYSLASNGSSNVYGIIQIPSDTRIYLCQNVVLQGQSSGVGKPVFCNQNCRSNHFTVTGITSAAHPTAVNIMIGTASTSAAHGLAVGSYVLHKGTSYFDTVYKVVSVPTSTSYTFWFYGASVASFTGQFSASANLVISAISSGTISPGMIVSGVGVTANTQILPSIVSLTQPPNNIGTYVTNTSQTVGPISMTGSLGFVGTATGYQADANIIVEGPGTIDLQNNATGLLAAQGMGSIWNKVKNLRVGTNFINCPKYGAYVGNSWNSYFTSPQVTTPSASVQFIGPCNGARVKDFYGEAGDDPVAFTVNNTGFTNYNLLDTDGTINSNGDLVDIVVDNLFIRRIQTRGILLDGGNGGTVRGVKISNIHKLNTSGNAIIEIGGPGGETSNFTDIDIDGAYGSSGDGYYVVMNANGGTVNIEKLCFRNFMERNTDEGMIGSIIDGVAFSSGTFNIGHMLIDNWHFKADNSSNSPQAFGLISLAATSPVIDKLTINNSSLNASGSFRRVALVNAQAAHGVKQIDINNCLVKGGQFAAAIFHVLSATSTTVYNCNNVRVTGTNCALAHVEQTCEITANNCVIDSSALGMIDYAPGSVKTLTLTATNCEMNSKPLVTSSGVASQVYKLSFKNISNYAANVLGTTPVVNTVAPAVSTAGLPASGTAFQNTTGVTQRYVVQGATTLSVQVSRDNVTYFTETGGAALTGWAVTLGPGDWLKLTYTGTPNWGIFQID